MSLTRARVLEVAASQVGVRERTGRNDVLYADRWGITGYAWCYAFVQWVFEQAGERLPFLTMYVPAGVQWCRDNGQNVERGGTPIPGDIVHFTWSMAEWPPNRAGTGDHVGIVESVDGDRLVCIEGNVGSPQGVWRMARSYGATVINFWRPTLYSDSGSLEPAQEDDMTPEEHQMLVDTAARALYVQQLAQENANRTLYLQQLAQANQNNVDATRAEAGQLHAGTRDVVTTSADAVMQNSAKLAAGIAVGGGGTVEVPVIDVAGSLKKASITDLLNEIGARTKGEAAT